MSDPNDPFDVDSVPSLGPCFCDPEHGYVCPNHAPDLGEKYRQRREQRLQNPDVAAAYADWENADPPRRRDSAFSPWAFVISLGCLVLLSVGVGLGLATGC